MKETECSPLEQPWASFITRNPCLRIDALDFSDLWDEEDLDQDLADDDSSRSKASPVQNPGHNLVPPTPPPAPPLAPPLLPGTSPVPLESGRRTLRLHWRELFSLQPLPRVSRFGPRSIWAALEPVHLDTNRLEYFLTCLLYSAILDAALHLSHSDTVEELNLIKQAKAQAPHCPLAPAEQCLLTLGNIKHLSSRLQLWAFALDYDTLEREIAEPLFHLKLAMEQLAANQTFRCILATVLAIGNFLNGCKARGFELSYLGKLSQVRDTHSRQPLLHHVCVLLLQLYPLSSDLYSDIPAVTRASKVNCDYSQLQASLDQLESLCKASWEQLRLGTGNEGSLRQRLPHFLKECGERLKVLRAVHRRVINRFHSFLLYLGYSRSMVRETSADVFCKTVSDFGLEYRATRHAILQQREREQEREREREKNEERGRDPSTPKSKAKAPQSPSQQSKLEEVLKTPASSSRFDFSLPRQRSKTPNTRGSSLHCT
uniref:FH2 domain-containing protein n=1 Tax=Pygocentrus nattereri TaxID=42514 RepID=A0AAR2L4L0_PYGNA